MDFLSEMHPVSFCHAFPVRLMQLLTDGFQLFFSGNQRKIGHINPFRSKASPDNRFSPAVFLADQTVQFFSQFVGDHLLF